LIAVGPSVAWLCVRCKGALESRKSGGSRSGPVFRGKAGEAEAGPCLGKSGGSRSVPVAEVREVVAS
jgi:hypothetical protein